MSEVCHNVQIEPPLQPLTGETLTFATANTEDGARLDISSQGFWDNQYQRAFFDVHVFNPNAPSHRNLQTVSVYRTGEAETLNSGPTSKGYVMLSWDHSLPLFVSTSGGLGRRTSVAYKRLASLLSRKRDQLYSLCYGMAAVPSRLLSATISHHLPPWCTINPWTCCLQ